VRFYFISSFTICRFFFKSFFFFCFSFISLLFFSIFPLLFPRFSLCQINKIIFFLIFLKLLVYCIKKFHLLFIFFCIFTFQKRKLFFALILNYYNGCLTKLVRKIHQNIYFKNVFFIVVRYLPVLDITNVR